MTNVNHESLAEACVRGKLVSRLRIFSPSETGNGQETGFALKYEKEPFYRVTVNQPEPRNLFIMPGRGGRSEAFRAFSEIRDRRSGKFLAWLPVGAGYWSYDRKGIYLVTEYPRAQYIIVLEPSNFPCWNINVSEDMTRPAPFRPADAHENAP
jgi:hypothetical protein